MQQEVINALYNELRICEVSIMKNIKNTVFKILN